MTKNSQWASRLVCGRLLLATFIAVCVTSCSGKPDGRREIERRIHDQSNGLIELVSYEKTNGTEMNLGVEVYAVKYKVEIAFTDNAYWSAPSFGIWSGNFCTDPDVKATQQDMAQAAKRFDVGALMRMGHAGKRRVAKGEHFVLSGTIEYQRTDNGWEPPTVSC